MLNSGPFGGTPSYYELFLSDDILTLFETHSESKYHYQKIEQKPEVIENSDNSYLNLQYFWNMHNERYPYFIERNIDWNNAKQYIEALDNSQLSEENLWEHLKVLVDYFNNDGHIWIADKKGETFYTPVNSGVKKAIRPKKELLLMLGEKYLDNHQYQTLGNGKIIYKFLPDSIGYINIMSFYQMSKAESKVKQLEDLSRDLDSLYNYFTEAKSLIIDVRYNGGGNDWNSLFCAGLFTSQNIPVLSKRPRIQGTNRYGPPEIYQAFAHKNNFANFEKIILSSGFSGSATESFLIASHNFPNSLTIGERSKGILSDSYVFELPNGMFFGTYSDKVYSFDGKVYENIGVSVNIETEMKESDFIKGIDTVLEYAIDLIKKKKALNKE